MEVKVLSSKLVRPAYNAGTAPPTDEYIPLSVFDRVTYKMQMAIIYAFPPPAPSTAAIEKGLEAVLAEYRAFAGQLGEAPDGTGPAVLLNDRGACWEYAQETTGFDPLVLMGHKCCEAHYQGKGCFIY